MEWSCSLWSWHLTTDILHCRNYSDINVPPEKTPTSCQSDIPNAAPEYCDDGRIQCQPSQCTATPTSGVATPFGISCTTSSLCSTRSDYSSVYSANGPATGSRQRDGLRKDQFSRSFTFSFFLVLSECCELVSPMDLRYQSNIF
jgi:hypothetical protein